MNPHATNHPISYFRKFHQLNALDLSPVFQRKPVWTDEQAAYLIDTILNKLPFPEVYVRSITDSDGETMLEVVDGQQRLRSIIRFYSGDLELTGDNVTNRWLGTTWEDLSTDEREAFWSYKVVVRELEGSTDAEVRDMFRRLNANQSSLNAQELRHSQYHGAFMTTVEDLANERWWLDNKVVTPAQIRRMLDAEFISELLVALISGPLNKKEGLDDYYADYNDEFPDHDYWTEIFVATRDLTKRLSGGDLRGWNSKTEYYSLFVAAGRVVYDDEIPTGRRLTSAVSRLADFRQQVNIGKRKDRTESLADNVATYVEAATRASTDISRRIERIDIVHSLITGG